MPQKLMDFNPLDILAAAALGQKNGSSNEALTKEEGSSHSTTKETKDAEEDTEEDMGKTTKLHIKSQASVHKLSDTKMPPQKTPWSPDAFSDQMELKPEKLCIIDLMQDLKHSAFGKKDPQIFSSDPYSDTTEKTNINNNLVCIKNILNLNKDIDVKVKEGDVDQGKEGLPSVVEELKNQESADVDSSTTEHGDVCSDTDTAESNEGTKCTENNSVDYVGIDHPYASLYSRSSEAALALDPLDEEGDVDVCSQNSPLNEETELHSQKMSPDCKTGILDDVTTASALDFYKISSFGRSRLPSSSSSTSSPTLEISKNGIKEEDGDSIQSITSPVPELSSPDKKAPKFGKFRIGTFASFSSNNLELEKYLRNKDSPHSNGKKLNIGIPTDINLLSSSLGSPTTSPALHPFLQSPIQDWDRSEADSEVHDDSSESRTPHRLSPDFTCEKVTEWEHPVFHDHDYCLKDGESKPDMESVKANFAKRKYTKRKSKLDAVNHEKIMKAKYLKKELLKQEPPKKPVQELEPSSLESSLKSNPVGRPKKRPLEKPIEEEIDPETGAKMKITGKFQDQYVYYLSKSSRTTSRRRQTPMPFPPDKIIVPAPKPGDIIVPHLTDADIETVRLKGRAALNLSERPHSFSSNDKLPPTVPLPPHHGTSSDYDVDSHIVSTVLSMENDNLSAAPSPTHSDVTTAGLNPDQPALTDCLRIMSGDSSLTSEHVLNYLLSVVKDDDVSSDTLLDDPGLDTTSSSLFPSLPSDSIYNKVDHLGVPDLPQSGTHPSSSSDSPKSSTFVNTISNSIHNNSQLSESDPFTNTVGKEDDDPVRLPDDLSSFIANSQGTSASSSSTSQSVFGSDLSSLGTPQLSSSFPRLTSVEKTLDYLGVKDGEIKLDQTEMFNSKFHSETDSSTLLTPESNVSSDDDTPWIVTVTLYFNDVPAIMVNSQPFIRLVDIHKQILPAKDTGILKKRCQLLKIPVLNCSEMQRYFLVQYGRAYNSKSTLIISKEQATELVTYYASPQPRSGKVDETSQNGRTTGRDSDSSSGLPGVFSKKKSYRMDKKATIDKGSTVASPVSCPVNGDIQKEPDTVEPGSSCGEVPSKRTRHKKINYLEMLRGEEKKSTDDSILETIECVIKAAPDYVDQLIKNKGSENSSKLPSQKKVKSSVLFERKSKKTKNSVQNLEKKTLKGSKGKKHRLDNYAEEEKIHIQDNEAWMRKLGNLHFDSDSLDHSPSKSRSKPLKLKVNSLLNFSSQKKGATSPSKKNGLFSRSNSSCSGSSESHLRVLAVAHQAAVATDQESRLPSQPADIHLDLFVKSSSPCVRCQTCSQYLSVPHFMRHHHVPMDSEWLATEAAHRILVPRNKENISEQEKKLWEEFHALQEAIGGFGERDDDESDSSGDDFDVDGDESSLGMSGASTLMSSCAREKLLHRNDHMEGESCSSEEEEEEEPDDSVRSSSDVSTPPLKHILVDQLSQKLKKEMASRCGLVPRVKPSPSETVSVLKKQGELQGQNPRTSSRKRKSKQLFSIENYYSPKKAIQDDDDHLSCSADDLSGTTEA